MPRPRLIAITALLLVPPAWAAEPDTTGMDASDLERAGLAALAEGRFDDAEAYLVAQADASPQSFEPWYNLAAVACARADADLAVTRLQRAIILGFTDFRTLSNDPDIACVRSSDFYSQSVARWQEVLGARRAADLAVARGLVPSNREERTVEPLKLEIVSSHDPVGTDQSRDEIEMIAAWANTTLFPQLLNPSAILNDPWVSIVLPDRAEFARWAVAVFGPGARGGLSSIGGAYDHNRRRLVAQDLGATLRHELFHVLHWRDMSRLGQQHAPWIQEGLASLVEDYDIEGGRLVPVPSWRTNIVKRLNDSGRLTPIDRLAATPMDRFVMSRPLAQYAQSRAVMLFLLDRGKLSEFYSEYTRSFDEDPTGLAALRRTLGMEQGELEDAYRDWLDSLPMVAETGSDLPATLGIEIENGTGDGVRVTGLPPGSRERTGLRIGSFITAINGRPTRDLSELIRVLSDYLPGESVTLSHRRGRVHSTSQVELLPRK